MKKPFALLKPLALALLCCATQAAWGAVAYNNADPSKYQNLFYNAGAEFGNEIKMAPGDVNPVTQFQVDYYLAPGASGNETITLRFYANDAPYGPGTVIKAPGTLLFDSGPLPIHTGYETMTIDRLALNLPDNFTWTAQFGGILGAEQVGLLVYSPPTAGFAYNDFWQNSGGKWQTMVLPNSPSTFGALVFKGPVAPSIVTGPVSKEVAMGNTVTFTVAASGTVPLSYQWLYNSNPLLGQTGPNLTLTDVQTSQAGPYSVSVSNSEGSVTSAPAVLTVDFPVTISQGPTNRTVNVGGSASFTVAASGTIPLNYQWLFNGAPLSGKTSTTLFLTQVRTNQAGLYTVRVTNLVSAVTSAPPAQLTVIVPVTITQGPTNQLVKVGDTVTLTVAATGTPPFTYQWFFESSALVGATNASLVLTNVQVTDTGTYSVMVNNPAGSSRPANALIQVAAAPQITSPPTNQVVLAGATVSLAVSASSSAPLNYQWQINGKSIKGATNANLTLKKIQSISAGSYSVVVNNLAGSATSAPPAVVTVNLPAKITQPPTDQVAVAGSNVVFQVVATGNPPLSYQWKKNGVDMKGQTNQTLALNNVQPANGGTYRVSVSNGFGSDVSAGATLTVLVPVTITAQPQGVTKEEYRSATLQVQAAGSQPLSYQWQKNGINLLLLNAFTDTLLLQPVYKDDAGDYRVVVSNAANSVTSSVARLTILVGPTLSAMTPTNRVTVNTNVTFRVTATGPGPFQYQWIKNWANLAGETNSSLTITKVRPADAGNYSVSVRNEGGTVTSGTTALVVIVPAYPFADNLAKIVTTNLASATFGGDNISATAEANEPNPMPGKPPKKSVWLGWQAPSSGVVSFDTWGSAFDTVLAVYTGTSGPGLTQITYNDDTLTLNRTGNLEPIRQSQVRFNATAGTVYKIAVDGYAGASGSIMLNWSLKVTPSKIPVITTQPLNAKVVGPYARKVTITVVANTAGINNVIYRWYRYNEQLTGTETQGPSLSLFSFGSVPVGGYRVSITNGDVPAGEQQDFTVFSDLVDLSVTESESSANGLWTGSRDKVGIFYPALTITQWPTNQFTTVGATVTLTVGAIGILPLTYQWYFFKVAIVGATNASLVLTNVQVTSGSPDSYSVQVNSPIGLLYSLEAFISVGRRFGATASLTAPSSNSASLNYQGQVKGKSSHHSLQSLITGDERVFSELSGLQVFSNFGATREPDQPNIGGLIGGAPVWFYYRPVANGTLQVSSQGSDFDAVLGAFTGPGPDWNNMELQAQDHNSGGNGGFSMITFPVTANTTYLIIIDGVNGANGVAHLTYNLATAPVITQQPATGPTLPVVLGANLNLSVGTTNLLAQVPLRYQWHLNGDAIPSATNATYAANNVNLSHSGDYEVLISNFAGTVRSQPVQVVVTVPVTVTAAPQNLTLALGGAGQFQVAASGTDPVSYQWRLNGKALPGETNSVLSLSDVQADQAGAYQVVVSNAANAVTNQSVLTVLLPPSIVTQPQAHVVVVGGTVTLAVAATGAAPLSYQWRFAGVDILGATNSTLVLNNVPPGAAGDYSVVVANSVDLVESLLAVVTVNVPVTILQPPQAQNVLPGDSVTFDVLAIGTMPLRYQWRFNGSPLAGQTNETLTLAGAQANQAGQYAVVVSNAAGSVASAPATLTVNLLPAISLGPANQTVVAGSNVVFAVAASGTAPLRYQWLLNGNAVAGQTNGTLTLLNVQAGQAGAYAVTVANVAGIVTSAAATLTVLAPPTITTGPASQSVVLGSTATFTVVAAGTSPLAYQWLYNGTAVAGQTNTILSLANVQTNQAGQYAVRVSNVAGSVTSAAAALAVNVPPFITLAPLSQTVLGGTNVILSVAAGGTAPLSYQWQFNGAALAGQTSATLLLANIQASQAGAYQAVVSNVAGSVTSVVAQLTVNTLPVITQQPRNLTGALGSNVTFTVTAVGAGVLRYSWNHNGAVIPGETRSTLTLNNLSLADVGNYSVTVANDTGLAASAVAQLLIVTGVAITQQPLGQTVAAGASVTMTVAATGTAPITYQWQLNGTNVAGATGATLTLANIQVGQSGSYQVTVSNAGSSVASSAAVVRVLAPSPRFVYEARLPDGSLRLVLSGPAGQAFLLQGSADLQTWTTLAPFTFGATNFLYVDAQATNLAQRFYRARSN